MAALRRLLQPRRWGRILRERPQAQEPGVRGERPETAGGPGRGQPHQQHGQRHEDTPVSNLLPRARAGTFIPTIIRALVYNGHIWYCTCCLLLLLWISLYHISKCMLLFISIAHCGYTSFEGVLVTVKLCI